MGQENCCGSASRKLLKNYDNQILEFIIGQQGSGKAKQFFGMLKQNAATKFNKMTNSQQRQRQFDRVIQLIDKDESSQIGKFDKMKQELNGVKVFKGLSGLDKDKLIKQASKQFRQQITDRLQSYIEGAERQFSLQKYKNFIK